MSPRARTDEIPSYADAPEPLTDREKSLLNRIFSDFMEIPPDWKAALKRWLESDPPILGKVTLGSTAPGGPLGPNTVTTGMIVDGTIIAADINSAYKDGSPTAVSLRSLGTGPNQAAAGDDPRFAAIGGDKNYVHNQVPLSASWTVVHNLNKYPVVEVVDSGNSAVIPNVSYVDLNTLTIGFAAPTSGKAYVN